MSVEIKALDKNDKALTKAFVKFPIKLYKDCPYYVPPLIMDEMGTMNEQKNPAFDFCEKQLFLAYRDNEIVGRIAGIINNRANTTWNVLQARFSYVDFIDDDEVVDALFEAAENWAKQKGMNSIIGPISFTDMDPEGLLVHGYDRISTMATLYSFPYYKTQIERLGYEKEIDWKEFYIPVPESVPLRHQRIADMVARRYGLKLLKFKNLKQITPYINKLFTLLNRAYKPLFGFTELSQRQIDYYVKMYVPFLRWDVVSIVIKESTDEIVGFGIAIPNLSRALVKARGKLLPFGWFYLWRALKSKKNKVVDLMLMGVAPEYQGKGVNAIIFNDFIPSAHKSGFRFAETNPELEVNNKIVSLWDGFEAENHKIRRCYIKPLS